jgi:transposase InsO family protein
MTTKYDPHENAIAERVNGILKTEYEIGEGRSYEKSRRII